MKQICYSVYIYTDVLLTMFSRLSFEVTGTTSRLVCASAFNCGTRIHPKISFNEPLVLSSPFLSPVGSVRTRRRLRLARKPKLPELTLDKQFPFKYTFRQVPTIFTKPGDRDKTLGFTDKSKCKLYFADSEELKTASDEVKRLFQLETGNRQDILAIKFDEVSKKVQRHRFDYDSKEMKIARETIKIRNNFEKLSANPFNAKLKIMINDKVGRRNRLLKELQKKDEDRFNWLVDVLEIDFERPMLGVTIYKPTRKLEIGRLTDEYCQKVRNDKIEACKKKMKEEQIVFLKEKKKTLEWIADKEKMIAEKRQELQVEEDLFWQKKDCRKL